LWVKAAYVDRGPTKNRRRVRPAPQGRAYREQRHFCHVTILLSNDERVEAKEGKGKKALAAKPAKLAESKSRRRGGAAAAPRAKRTAPKAEAEPKTEGSPEKKAKRSPKPKAAAEEKSTEE